MRLFITFLSVIWLAGAVAVAQDKAAEKPGAKQKTEKGSKSAVEKKTPFGTVKYEEKTEQEKEEPPSNMRAFEDGDTVRFERQTPFGVNKWSKKKSEMDETERAVVERQRRDKGKQ